MFEATGEKTKGLREAGPLFIAIGLCGILHDELIGQPEVDDALRGDDNVAVASGACEERAGASA